MDRLLYRMITLNNGQKPMTARHQIEILASNIFDFDSLPILSVTEKESKNKKILLHDFLRLKLYVVFLLAKVTEKNSRLSIF